MFKPFRYLRIFLRLSGWIGGLTLWAGIASFATGLDLSSAASAIGTEGKQANVIILEKALLEASGSGRLRGRQPKTG